MSILEIDTSARRALVFTPMEVDWRLLVDAAVHAESVGFEAVVVPEGWGLDATLVLSEIARNTSRIGVVGGILSIWGRSAATLAMTAAMLDDLSGGASRRHRRHGPSPARRATGRRLRRPPRAPARR